MSVSAKINKDGLNATILGDNKTSAKIVTKNNIRVNKIKLVTIESGETKDIPTEEVKLITFTNEDLVNGQLIRLHGLNRRVVTVTVTNPDGIEFKPRINNLADNTRVLIDLSRYKIVGTWYATIR